MTDDVRPYRYELDQELVHDTSIFRVLRRLIRQARPDGVYGCLCGLCGGETYWVRVVEREARLLCTGCDTAVATFDLSHDARTPPN